MIELVVAGVVFALVAMFVLGIVGAILGLVFSLVLLPFKLLGFAFKGLGFLIALPFLVILAVGGGLLLGIGALALFTPILPLALVIWGLWWLLRRRPAATS